MAPRVAVNEEPNPNDNHLAMENESEIKEDINSFLLLLHDMNDAIYCLTKIMSESEISGNVDEYLIDEAGVWRSVFFTDITKRNNFPKDHYKDDSNFYWELAIIKYVRCFTSGMRSYLSKDEVFNDENLIICHDYFYDLRNKHIAHSVNIFEAGICGANLSPKNSNSKKLISIFGLIVSKSNEMPVTRKIFYSLCKKSLRFIESKLQNMANELFKECSKIDLESLYKRPYCAFVAPGSKDVRKGKKR